MEHCNGDGAGPEHGYACGRGDKAPTGGGSAGAAGAAVLVAQGLATGCSGRRAFGKVTEDEPCPPPPPPPPFLFIRLRDNRKATRANFATIANSDSFTCKIIQFKILI